MGKIKIWKNGICTEAEFQAPALLQTVLEQCGFPIDHPCGGRGSCGKCAVRLQGAVSSPNGAEQKAGARLSCQAVLLGDAQVWLHNSRESLIELSGSDTVTDALAGSGFGAALDIGTTTLAMKLYNLGTGKMLSSAACMNPQRSVAADVMGRIGAALEGKAEQLKLQILDAITRMRRDACKQAGILEESLKTMVITGNTTMLYLLNGRHPGCLARAPFEADTLYGAEAELLGMKVYYPRCMNAFVGGDITCSVLASGMTHSEETSLLCDIGTNGEIALWKNGRLYVTSTAAGPAFEGAGISCGCGSVVGAIDQVRAKDGIICVHTISDAPAVGVCGSGLIDAIAAFLQTEQIDETGASESDFLLLKDGIGLIPRDIRAVQLAKAAIAAGIQTLLETAQVNLQEIGTVYIAGGFGSHLNVASAAEIGLIPASVQDRVQVIGNASLSGAVSMLLYPSLRTEGEALANASRHINLGGNPRFNQNYMEQMLFGDDDLFD